MSEQSPWGQPPQPSYGQPTGATPGGGYPPPPSQGPPQGPPGGPPPGWAPPSYGGGPSGPPPPSRRTGQIVAIVVGVLVVIAAVVVTLVVATGSDEVDQAGDDPSTTSAQSDPTDSTDDPSSEAPDDPTDDPTGEPSDPTTSSDPEPVEIPEDAVVGDGYYFELPGIGWQDALAEAQGADIGSTLDSIIILGSSLDLAQSNILVEALTAGGAPDLETLEDQWKRNLSGDDGAVPADIDDITIDGERAIGVEFIDRENVNGVFIDQIAYLALHDGNQYSVALSLPSDNDSVSRGDFEKVLASWTWTD